MRAERKEELHPDLETESTVLESQGGPPAGGDVEFAIPQPGELIFGRFLLLEQVGSGGGGRVHRAFDQREEQEVAIKLLRRPSQLSRFKSEYRLQRRLAHPHLLSPGELVVSPEMAAITMPYLRGARSLRHAIKDCRATEREQSARLWFAQLSEVLSALHEAGVVHCDIKPSNVLIDTGGEVRLIDFGAASLDGEAWGLRAGTPLYVAPEVVEGNEPSPKADWYSFGITLWEALAGRPPLMGARGDVFGRKCADELPPLPGESRGSELARLAERLVARDPDARPSSEEVLRSFGVSPSPRPTLLPFVGRDEELSQLQDYYDRSKAGRAVVVDLRGEPGIGKTRLVTEFCDRLRKEESPPTILVSSCSGFESVPYNVLDEIFDQICRAFAGGTSVVPAELEADYAALAQIFPGFALLLSHEPREARREITSESRSSAICALTHLFSSLTEQRPLVLCLDQLTWADSDSAQIIGGLLHKGPRLPLLILQMTRSDGVNRSKYLHKMSEQGISSEKLEILELASTDAANMLGGAADTIDCGNPQRLLRKQQGGDFLKTLPPSTLFTAQFLAEAAQPLSEEVVKEALGSEAVGSGVLRVLEEQALIKREERGSSRIFVPVHDQTIELLVAPLSTAEKREIHLSLAEVLKKQEPLPHALVAEHLIAAGEEAQVVAYADLAASNARTAGAFDAEASWLRLARGLLMKSPRDSEKERRYFSERLALAYADGGYGCSAADEFLLLARDQSEESQRGYCLAAAQQLLRDGHWDRGFTLLNELAAQARLSLSQRTSLMWSRFLKERVQLARALARPPKREAHKSASELFRIEISTAAKSGYLQRDCVSAAYFSALALRLALEKGEPRRIALGLVDEVLFQSNRGSKDKGRRVAQLLQRVRGLSDECQDDFLTTYLGVAEGGCAMFSGEYPHAYRILVSTERRLRSAHPERTWELTNCRMFLITSAQFCSSFVESQRMLDRWLEEAHLRRDLTAQRHFLSEAVFTRLALGQADRAAAALESALALTESEEQAASLLIHQRYHLTLYGGSRPKALRVLLKELRAFPRLPRAFSQRLRVMVHVYQAGAELELLRAEKPSRLAIFRVRRHIKQVESEGAGYASAYAKLLRAAVAQTEGRGETVERLLNEAKNAFEGSVPLMAAVAAYRLAQLFPLRYCHVSASRKLRELGVVQPDAFVVGLAPGFSIWKAFNAS